MTPEREPHSLSAPVATTVANGIDRIAIFTGDLSAFSVRWGVGELVNRFPEIRWLLVEHRPPRSLRIVARNKWRQLRREGVRTIFDLLQTAARALAALLPRSVKTIQGAPGADYELASILRRAGVSLLRPGDIHAPDSLAAIRQFAPDLGISIAAPILRRELFEIPRQGTINLHKGKLPFFRGMPPAFWEIWTGAVEVGCSIHRVDRSLDTGPILLQNTIPVEPFSTVRGLQITLDGVGVEMMCEAVRRIANGTASWTPQAEGGHTYRKPTIAQWAAIRTLEPGRPLHDWKCVVKELFFLIYVALVRPLARAMLALFNQQRISVLLYHRVSDHMRDSVTVGIEQFEKQMVEVRKRCRIVGSRTLWRTAFGDPASSRLSRSPSTTGIATISSMRRRSCCGTEFPRRFFISTALIESDRGFPHDLEKLGKAVPAMDWSQVAGLRRWGFTVGSHTETHINCVKADARAVDREIVDSMGTLRQRLALMDVSFAYPYGGRGDFNEHCARA